MKRISISVSDSLHEKMQKFKGDINYSQVARTAIEQEIRKFELWTDPVKDFAELIEKFREQKEEFMDGWEKEGFERGQKYIEMSSFAEAESYIESLPEGLRRGEPWPNNEELVAYESDYYGEDDWTSTSAKAFWIGFAKGAKSIWKEVEKKL